MPSTVVIVSMIVVVVVVGGEVEAAGHRHVAHHPGSSVGGLLVRTCLKTKLIISNTINLFLFESIQQKRDQT
jgi:hypothetical protein